MRSQVGHFGRRIGTLLQTRAAERPIASDPVPSPVAVPWRAELWVYVVLAVVALVAFCLGAGAKGVFGDEAYSLSTAATAWSCCCRR